MPTYSYRCTECGNEFDVRQSFSDEPLKVCEACGGSLRKLFNSVGIVFKGSGFYHNDARSSSSTLHSKNSEGREASDSAGSGSGEGASSENGNAGSHSGNANAHSQDTGSQSVSTDSGRAAGSAGSPRIDELLHFDNRLCIEASRSRPGLGQARHGKPLP